MRALVAVLISCWISSASAGTVSGVPPVNRLIVPLDPNESYMAAIIAATPCTPDTTKSPTPVFTWDHQTNVVPPIDGYSIWERVQGTTNWSPKLDIPCSWEIDDATGIEKPGTRTCQGAINYSAPRGGTMGYPMQRGTPEELKVVESAVTAWNVNGESPSLSNIVAVCMPTICRKGMTCN